ncbi:hypothetical protein M758_7G093400 [Ceratodon purpureus]|uniref:Uncharacterized protein n=1 Tax=Ceratodon purpureus TaxID=3225 RepID=A0A8T0H6U7_CERPU|nr:hypothetical protein KC19_7G099800 [Ceratodon purpureus]KAG0610812.1 hypothetical protein M758_7G093400 [Ceratodon purpureus]
MLIDITDQLIVCLQVIDCLIDILNVTMAEKVPDETESSSRTRSESKQVDFSLGKAPIQKEERTGSRRFSVPVTQAEKEATQKELDAIEPPERIPSILRSMPVDLHRATSPPQRPYVSRESVSPIGYPPESL